MAYKLFLELSSKTPCKSKLLRKREKYGKPCTKEYMDKKNPYVLTSQTINWTRVEDHRGRHYAFWF
jgi:hypothetical protein